MMVKERNLNDLRYKSCQIEPMAVRGMKLKHFHEQIHSDWQIIDDRYLERTFKTKDFNDSLLFTNKIGFYAEQEDHHPYIELTWGSVKVILYTHELDGLSENDFILASKFDFIYL